MLILRLRWASWSAPVSSSWCPNIILLLLFIRGIKLLDFSPYCEERRSGAKMLRGEGTIYSYFTVVICVFALTTAKFRFYPGIDLPISSSESSRLSCCPFSFFPSFCNHVLESLDSYVCVCCRNLCSFYCCFNFLSSIIFYSSGDLEIFCGEGDRMKEFSFPVPLRFEASIGEETGFFGYYIVILFTGVSALISPLAYSSYAVSCCLVNPNLGEFWLELYLETCVVSFIVGELGGSWAFWKPSSSRSFLFLSMSSFAFSILSYKTASCFSRAIYFWSLVLWRPISAKSVVFYFCSSYATSAGSIPSYYAFALTVSSFIKLTMSPGFFCGLTTSALELDPPILDFTQ